MKLSEISVGTEYAVIHRFTLINTEKQDLKEVTACRRSDVDKVTLESKAKYIYVGGSNANNTDKSQFVEAPKNASTNIGVLVSFKGNNETTYLVVRLSEVLHKWAVIEPVWLAQEEEIRKARAHAEAVEEVNRKKRENARLHAERAQKNLPTTLKTLLGGHLYGDVRVEYSTYNTDPSAQVTMSLKDLERIIERAFDNNEEVA